MGVLEGPDGRRVELLPRTLVGRSPSCDVVLADPSVSGEHAVVAWIDGRWRLRDLGSRNGTAVGDRPVSSEPVALAVGDRVAFGRAPGGWTLIEAAAPRPRAVAGDGTVVEADGDLLVLPDPGTPEVTVARGDGGWWLEDDAGTRRVSDGDAVVAGGVRWELRLPVGLAATVERAGRLDDVGFVFAVSADEEHASWGTTEPVARELGDRVHAYLLLTLARARREDADAGVDAGARGWRYADELARGLGITPEVLKVYVYRARRQLQEAGVVGAAALIERRAASNQIRLGTDRFEIVRR